MTEFQNYLDVVYLGNSLQNYLIAIGFILTGSFLHSIISNLIVRIFARFFRKWEFKLSFKEYYEHLKKPIGFLLFLIFLFLAAHVLNWPPEFNLAPVEEFGVRRASLRIFQFILAIAFIRLSVKLIVVFGEMLKKKAEKSVSKQDDQLIPFVIELAKILVIFIGSLITISSIFHLNVGSLVAGLGIGGLAVALAAKESLENLFGSFTIFFDKPFVVGDLVKVGEIEGVVERVGFRSTRIRTLEKSYLTIPNKKMIDAELDNRSLRTFRRVKFNLGLTYGTSKKILQDIVTDIKKYLDEHPHTNQEAQVRFLNFGSSSLDIMVLYYIDTMDYAIYLEFKEEINYRIMDIVEKHKGEFAFPTQTIHIQK